jgi:predicted histone-like DNA-binding protein
MDFKFKAIAKKNPREPQAPAKFYPSPVYTGDVTIRELAKEIAELSSLNTIDVLAVLEGFLTKIPQKLSQGYIVKLRDFGNLRITFSSLPSDTADKVTADKIKKAKVNFRPSILFSELTGVVKFTKE